MKGLAFWSRAMGLGLGLGLGEASGDSGRKGDLK